VLTRIFAEAGVKIEDRLDLVRLDPQWRCFFDDGTRIDLGEDVGAMAGEMDRFAPGTKAGDGYRRFQGLAEHLHGVSERFFFWKPVEDMLDTFDLKANLNPNTLRDVLSLRMGSSVAGTIRAKVKDKRLAQMLDHFVQYVGSSPYGSPACSAPSPTCRPLTGSGTRWAARRAVVTALHKLATELGCEFRAGEEVTGLDLQGGAVKGVRTSAGRRAAGRRRGLEHGRDPHLPRARGRRGGARVRPQGLRARLLGRGALPRPVQGATSTWPTTTSSSPGTRRRSSTSSTSAASRRPTRPATCAAPRRPIPSVAPEGGEALYVLVHTPYLRPHHDWSKMLPGLPAGDPRQAEADRRACTTSRTGSWSSGT
jgi:phytoene dehydrogenase-like protein